ncbi:MAG: TRAP transporter small permease [Synergistaceae bacterium]|jgi:TRAP-type C4-dicarboxylate transport system permease small subunit|nr:TRAP transporter small permease [Synergistaceae bacterium]
MKYLEKVLAFLAGLSLFVVFGVVFAQVFQRYVFNIALPWATDVIRIAFVYTIFLGMTLGVIKKLHLNIDFLIHSFPASWKPFFGLLSNAVTFIFLSAVLAYSFPFIRHNIDQTMPYLNLSMAWVYGVIPVGAAVMLCALLTDTVKTIALRSGAKAD